MPAPSIILCALGLVFTSLSTGNERTADAGAKRHIALKSGIRMAYRVAGPENGPPLVLLHGLGDTSRSWTLLLPELARHNRLYIPDLRGHGETEAPACCYALPDLAFDVVAFMDALKIETAAIAGHSMGSFIGQYVATAYPSRVRRLVLVGSSDTTVGTEVIEWLWAQAQTFDAKVPASFVDEWQANPTPVRAEFLAEVKRETGEVPVHVWRGVARALLTEDHRGFLGQIKIPTLILAGEKDPMFTRPSQERLHQALPQARLKIYPEVGHNLHWELSERVAAEIEAFVRPAASPQGSPQENAR